MLPPFFLDYTEQGNCEARRNFAEGKVVAKRLILTVPADLAKSPCPCRKLPEREISVFFFEE